MFESLGPPWFVMTRRPTPSTPQGDKVVETDTKEQADHIVAALNAEHVSWREAIDRYKASPVGVDTTLGRPSTPGPAGGAP
jgi:hypothetical protein